MERSPLNMPRRFRGPSQAPYTRKSLEHANDRGYHAARYEASQRLPVNNDSQPRGSDFIPLNVSAPVTRLERRSADWRNPASWRDNSSPRGWYNHRGSSRGSPRGNCGNRYSSHKNFHMQNRRGHKVPSHRLLHISRYIDMKSTLEDPWADLVKKLDDSKGKSQDETHEKVSSLDTRMLTDRESTKESESKDSKDSNVDNSQCKDSENVSPVDTRSENTDQCRAM